MQGLICDMKGGEKEVLRVEIMICESMLKGVLYENLWTNGDKEKFHDRE